MIKCLELYSLLLERKDFVNGHPGFNYLMEKFKRDIYGIQKNPLTHAPLSEKNWYECVSKKNFESNNELLFYVFYMCLWFIWKTLGFYTGFTTAVKYGMPSKVVHFSMSTIVSCRSTNSLVMWNRENSLITGSSW